VTLHFSPLSRKCHSVRRILAHYHPATYLDSRAPSKSGAPAFRQPIGVSLLVAAHESSGVRIPEKRGFPIRGRADSCL